MLKEFKKFAIKGNVMDMAIGVIIGAAFGKIVSSLVADIIMPPFGALMGGMDLTKFAWTLREAIGETPAITLNYGAFINTVLDFLVISFTIFLVVKQMNKLKKKEEEKTPTISEEVLLLREIRDALNNKTPKQ